MQQTRVLDALEAGLPLSRPVSRYLWCRCNLSAAKGAAACNLAATPPAGDRLTPDCIRCGGHAGGTRVTWRNRAWSAFPQVKPGLLVVLTGPTSKPFFDLLSRLADGPIAQRSQPHKVPTRAFRFTPEQTRDITTAYERGATMAALAKQYGVKRQTIAELLKRQGSTIRPRKVLSPEQAEEAVRLYSTGMSSAAIANRLGFDAATIWHALKKRGAVMRSPNG